MEGPSVILQGPAVVSMCWDARLCLSPSPTSLTYSAGSPPPPAPASGLWGGEEERQSCGGRGGGEKRNGDGRREGKGQARSLLTAPASVLMGEGVRREEERGMVTVTSPWLSTPSLAYPDPSPSLLSWVGPTHSREHATAGSQSAPRTLGGFQRGPASRSSVSQSLQAEEADAC